LSASTESARPRNAATVVIARPTTTPDLPGAAFEIYMVRRSAKSPFMPSTLVFPGGRLDPEDGPETDDATWVRAGRRECVEEAQLDPGDDLLWFDTWLTPSAESRRRYLARFYLARLLAGAGDEAVADGTETHAGRWATVARHLEGWDRAEVDLPPPTLSTLLRMAPLSFAALPSLAEADPTGAILPKVTLTQGRPTIIMPHDPHYPDVPGEARPAPARTASLPSRFVRDERVWRPWDDEHSP
jgi:8-oxo-dGTP pyrophosphatase MutT (NUDIX family)